MKGFSGFKDSPVKQEEKCYIDKDGKKICRGPVDQFHKIFPDKKKKIGDKTSPPRVVNVIKKWKKE